jgi:hypothetical protein
MADPVSVHGSEETSLELIRRALDDERRWDEIEALSPSEVVDGARVRDRSLPRRYRRGRLANYQQTPQP